MTIVPMPIRSRSSITDASSAYDCARAVATRLQVVRAVEVDRVDVRQRDEVLDLDGLRRGRGHLLELAGLELDVLPLARLVALRVSCRSRPRARTSPTPACT